MDYSKMTMVQIRKTDVYKKLPRAVGKSKLKKNALVKLLTERTKPKS